MKRPLDRTIKSNIKCEHCQFYNKDRGTCHEDRWVVIEIPYWKKCEAFQWREAAAFKPNQNPAVRVLAPEVKDYEI